MEAVGVLQHRTNSEPSIGWPGGVSVLTNTTPDIRSRRGVETAGAAVNRSVLTQEVSAGLRQRRSRCVGGNNDGPMPVEKSDYPI